MQPEKPTVSVVIPCRNEGRYIKRVLRRLLEQDYSGLFEIIVVDGMSLDDTVEQVRSLRVGQWTDNLKILSNPRIIIPAGLNIGIKNAVGEIVIRMDGHALPQRDYVRKAVNTLLESGYDVVGGICKSVPAADNNWAKAISIGISYIFGVGDSRFRIANSQQSACFVDTVPFGCFKKSLWKELGGFDESLLTNEDYDFNYRVRKKDGTVYLTPELVTEYVARSSLAELAKQYFRYGKWKFRMLLKQPRSIRLRHFVPPIFLLVLFLTGVLSMSLIPASILFVVLLATYLMANLVAAVHASQKNKNLRLFPYLIIVFIIMHFSWGGGFWYSIFEQIGRKKS